MTVIFARPANGQHHPSRMNYVGLRPIEAIWACSSPLRPWGRHLFAMR
jgi:hypothetical protein